MLHNWTAENEDSRERGIEYYARQLADGECAIPWLADEYRERLLGGWGDTDHGLEIDRLTAARDWEGIIELRDRVAEEVVRERYERIMSETAQAAAEELAE